MNKPLKKLLYSELSDFTFPSLSQHPTVDMIRDDGKCFNMDEATGQIVEVQLPPGDSIWNHIIPFGRAKR